MATLLQKLDAKEPITVLVTGAAGQIAYSLIYLVARGALFGEAQRVNIHLLDIPPLAEKLDAIVMELDDCASPVVAKVVATTDYAVAFAGVDVALLVGARPRGPGMERKDLLAANAAIFKGQGEALERYASRDVKVLVVGNPANTNALIAAKFAPSIPRANFTALTRLDQNRAKSAIAKRTGTAVDAVTGVIIWGNHSTTQYPDVRFATAAGAPVPAAVADDAWLHGPFITAIQQRGKAVIDKRGASSAASAAHAIVDHVRDWLLGSAGAWVSMGVVTGADAPYGIASDLVFSFPLITHRGGSYSVVADLAVDAFSADKLKATEKELLEERTMAFEVVGAPAGGAGGAASS